MGLVRIPTLTEKRPAMADKHTCEHLKRGGGNPKSSGKGGGASGGPDPHVAQNARLRGEDPSPDNRARGETSRGDRRQ
jgi:hypothetical protein